MASVHPPASPRILVVDDEFIIRFTLAEVLGEAGFEVIEAQSGEEALAILEADREIGLLLTDIRMPGCMDGRSLAGRVRQIRPELPVLFMTGEPELCPAGGDSPLEGYISKPYRLSELCQAVRQMTAQTA